MIIRRCVEQRRGRAAATVEVNEVNVSERPMRERSRTERTEGGVPRAQREAEGEVSADPQAFQGKKGPTFFI